MDQCTPGPHQLPRPRSLHGSPGWKTPSQIARDSLRRKTGKCMRLVGWHEFSSSRPVEEITGEASRQIGWGHRRRAWPRGVADSLCVRSHVTQIGKWALAQPHSLFSHLDVCWGNAIKCTLRHGRRKSRGRASTSCGCYGEGRERGREAF